MQLHPIVTPYTKFNSKCPIDLNIRAKTVKLLEVNIGVNFCVFGLSQVFSIITLKTQIAKEKIDKLDFMKFKAFGHQCTLSQNFKMGEIFANICAITDLYLDCMKNSYTLTMK